MHSGSAVLIGTLGGGMSSRGPTILGALAPVGTPYERSHVTVWSGPTGEKQSVCGAVGVLYGFPGPALISASSVGLLGTTNYSECSLRDAVDKTLGIPASAHSFTWLFFLWHSEFELLSQGDGLQSHLHR